MKTPAPGTDIQGLLERFKEAQNSSVVGQTFNTFRELASVLRSETEIFGGYPETDTWSLRIIRALCGDHPEVGLTGMIGKSYNVAFWLALRLLSDVEGTRAVIMSSSKRRADKTILIHLRQFIREIGHVTSTRLKEDAYFFRPSWGTEGLETAMKLNGMRARQGGHLILVVDDAEKLHPGVLDVWRDNILPGNFGSARMVMAGIPGETDSPFGKFCKPVQGWDNLDVQAERWDTTHGICIRADGEKLPEFRDIFPRCTYLPDREDLEDAKGRLDSGDYQRLIRARWKHSSFHP